MAQAFIPLEKEFSKNTFDYKEVKREGLIAMYSQTDSESGKLIAYEVFEVQEMKAGFAGPKRYPQPAREVMPSAVTWGRLGFTCHTTEIANKYFEKLQQQISLREK